MNKLVPAALALLALSTSALAQEGAARPAFMAVDPALSLRLPACPEGTPLFVRGNRLVCGTATATARNCPANQIMVGLQADGSLICRPVPAGCHLN